MPCLAVVSTLLCDYTTSFLSLLLLLSSIWVLISNLLFIMSSASRNILERALLGVCIHWAPFLTFILVRIWLWLAFLLHVSAQCLWSEYPWSKCPLFSIQLTLRVGGAPEQGRIPSGSGLDSAGAPFSPPTPLLPPIHKQQMFTFSLCGYLM